MSSWADIWQQTVSLLAQREQLSPGFDAWLKRSRPIHADGQLLVVEVPDPFTRDWVRARYQQALEGCLAHILGCPCALDLVTPPEAGQRERPAAESEAASPPAPAAAPPAESVPALAPLPPAGAAPEEAPVRGLNPRYTFETFVVGNSNRFAYSACRGVVAHPGGPYNPLFIYGGVGLGKTHLMQAVAQEFLRDRPSLRVLYLTTEEFTNELVDALQRKSMPSFRARYRSVDVLLLDDVHFVAGKESTQEEFFHTFNTLYEAGRQLVLSSDRPPGEIPKLEERLRSRFAWGLLADIQPPDFETRLAILRQRTREMQAQVHDEVLAYIAEQVRSNIRVLEGALRRVITAARLAQQLPTLELAARELRPLSDAQRRPVTVERVQEVVAEHFGLKAQDLRGKARTREVAFARQVAMVLARELTQASLPFIGEQFGGRDHSTVLHAIDKVQALSRRDPEVADLLRHLRQRLQQWL